ncbi:MAG: hypothetical protein KDD78_01560 [Caldilineaceae bacterium]|nr:hypothetical protein [Caldilineaceae bacterium]
MIRFTVLQLVMYTLVFYGLGVATPLFFLRTQATDNEDSCFLTVVLFGIVAFVILAIIGVIFLAP